MRELYTQQLTTMKTKKPQCAKPSATRMVEEDGIAWCGPSKHNKKGGSIAEPPFYVLAT